MGQSFSTVWEKPQIKPHVFFREPNVVPSVLPKVVPKTPEPIKVPEAVQAVPLVPSVPMQTVPSVPLVPSVPVSPKASARPSASVYDVDLDALDAMPTLQGYGLTGFDYKTSTVRSTVRSTDPSDTPAYPSALNLPMKYSAEPYSSEPYLLANPGSPRQTIYVDEKDMKKKKNSRGGF